MVNRYFKAYTLDEFDRFIRNFNFTRPINHIQIHHTWKPRKTDYQGEKTIEAIWRYHTETRGWSDIGEHFTISPDGLIWDGRDLNVIPAGISGHNIGGMMFEMIGNFDKGQEVLEGKQLDSILGAVNIMLDHLNLTTVDIVFHREYANKTCPGSGITKDWFIAQINKWKEEHWQVKGETPLPFKDLTPKHWAYPSIKRLYDIGIITGTSQDQFGTGQPLKREDAAVLLDRLLQYLEKQKD
ncbi:N-acetylmuramoyl-L-alanine amidase [Tepidibacillus infernus]